MTTIQGKKYNFEIVSYHRRIGFCFFIRAKCKSTGRFSCINNLNAILSELGVDLDDPKFADSMWVVTKNESHEFVKTAKEFLSNSYFLNYLERKLDEDREAGEWENVLHA